MSTDDFKPETWTIPSNEALKISLVSSAQDKAVQFPPSFTYPIYGDDETIFGFKNLVIHLVFDSVSFKPFINAKYDAKMDNTDDILKKLESELPTDDIVIKDENIWRDVCEVEESSYSLPRESLKVGEYTTSDSNVFVIYKAKLQEDPALSKLHRRMQIFSLLFIEAATYINEKEPYWEIYWLFNKKTKECLGYVTTYKYWNYNGHESFDSKAYQRTYRKRISQFLILPPYQGKGHGSKLYKCIYNSWKGDSSVTEVTVEDPNESFDDLRDLNDLDMLFKDGFFATLMDTIGIDNNIDSKWLQHKRKEYKLEKRQFERCVEMTLLQSQKLEVYKTHVKRRLYQKNFEALNDIPTEAEKIKAINSSFESLTDDYKRILSKCTFTDS